MGAGVNGTGLDETVVVGSYTWTLDLSPTDARMLVSGYQSWSEAELRPLLDRQARPTLTALQEQGHDPGFLPGDDAGEAGVWRSHTVVAVLRPDGGGWVGCALDAARSFTHWEARAIGGRVWLSVRAEGPEVAVRLVETGDVAGTIEALSADLGRAMGARTPAPLRVWCSWYSYFRGVTLENMLENARLARQLELPFDVFQLDDGFQAELGDWTQPSAHFGGHAWALPARLRDLGFGAGLWLAPFIASPRSQLYRDHPDWFIGSPAGGPQPIGDNWGGAYFGLDTTRPAVQDWLRDLARTVTGWGYSYLKIDFLFGAVVPGMRQDQSLSRAEAYRLGLQAIREGAPEAFILACGAPLASSTGLVDAMRTGPDVAPLWDDGARRVWLQDGTSPSARNALHTSLSRWYQHAWYQPDPDVTINRRELSLLNDAERGALLGLLDVTGGLRATSDPLAMLDGAALAELRQALTLSRPDRPRTLAQAPTQAFGGAVTHFTRGTFNLSGAPQGGAPAHSYVPAHRHQEST